MASNPLLRSSFSTQNRVARIDGTVNRPAATISDEQRCEEVQLAAGRSCHRGEPRSPASLDLVLAQEALEEPAVPLLVVEDLDHHVLGDRVDALGLLDHPRVVLDRPGLGLDHAADHVDDVGLLLRRLQVGLFGG